MLHCNMNLSATLELGLDDLLADLRHARRQGDMGRLALIAYCEVRSWARQAGQFGIAELSTAMFVAEPRASRQVFLDDVDRLIRDLEHVQDSLPKPPARAWPMVASPTGSPQAC